jgi:hypothetical protein
MERRRRPSLSKEQDAVWVSFLSAVWPEGVRSASPDVAGESNGEVEGRASWLKLLSSDLSLSWLVASSNVWLRRSVSSIVDIKTAARLR